MADNSEVKDNLKKWIELDDRARELQGQLKMIREEKKQ
jgi:hypothetical protein